MQNSFILPFCASAFAAIAVGIFGYRLSYTIKRHLHGFSARALPARLLARIDAMSIAPAFCRFGNGKQIKNLVAISGLRSEWTAERFLAMKKISGAISIVLISWILVMFPISGTVKWAYIIMIFLLGWFWPELFLRRRATLRRKRIQKTLAYMIDLLRLQVGAGLSVESSFRMLAKHIGGEWKKELAHLVFLLNHGVSLNDALAKMASRNDSDDLNRFVLAVRQAQTFGASLSETFAIQAEMLRTRRRQRAEEKARLASVKIALPLVFFIFPALLIIYLAPAVLRIMQIF